MMAFSLFITSGFVHANSDTRDENKLTETLSTASRLGLIETSGGAYIGTYTCL